MSELTHEEKREIAELEAIRRLNEYDVIKPELTRLRAREARLVGALNSINARCNGIVSNVLIRPKEIVEAIEKFREVSAKALLDEG